MLLSPRAEYKAYQTILHLSFHKLNNIASELNEIITRNIKVL